MKNELIIKKCNKCGAMIKIIKDCSCNDCGIICCNETMKEIKANSTDAAVEKHVPSYEVVEDTIKVRVNHVMEEDHFIKWVCLKTENKEEYAYFNPQKEAVAEFKNAPSGILYAYCNKHGLWSTKL